MADDWQLTTLMSKKSPNYVSYQLKIRCYRNRANINIGRITITSIAFAKLDKGLLDNLLKPENKTKLTDLLNHHVVEGKINFKDLKDGHTTVDGAVIMNHDVQATNGIIHSLETVMFKN